MSISEKIIKEEEKETVPHIVDEVQSTTVIIAEKHNPISDFDHFVLTDLENLHQSSQDNLKAEIQKTSKQILELLNQNITLNDLFDSKELN